MTGVSTNGAGGEPAARPSRRGERGGVTRRPFLLLLGSVLCWFCFNFACTGRPQVHTGLLRPEEPTELPVEADAWPIRLAMYNVWAIPLISSDMGSRTARMPEALASFDADLICLQEAWSGTTRGALARGLKPRYATARSEGGGLMILSRFPIREDRFTPFPVFPGLSPPEWFAQKGILEAVVETPAGPVRVVNAHLALAFGEGNPRQRQLEFLLDHLDGERDLPIVLAADLNTPPVWGGELVPDYLDVVDRGLTDVKPPIKRAGVWDPGPATRVGWPRPHPEPHYHPDHIFIRAGESATLTPGTFRLALDTPETALSDHNLLLTDLTLHRHP